MSISHLKLDSSNSIQKSKSNKAQNEAKKPSAVKKALNFLFLTDYDEK